MEYKREERVSRSKTIRKSMREAFGIRKHREKIPMARKIDSRLSEYFHDHDNAASRISDAKIAKVREVMEPDDRTAFKDADIALALVSDYSNGDPEKAFDLLATLEQAEAGVIEPYSPDITLAGAVNRNGVTCWLDSVLFAMFARSDDFEPMLFHTFTEPSKKRLAILIRLWINLLRSGKLITIGITQQIQDCLSDCGWPEAASRQQQDASEAFGRLTEFLQLPPLTLKKDMFHQGKADQDDHKFTHERTIDIGIPPAREDGSPIKLEECLESYFDETVHVSRQKAESVRRNTIGSGWAKALEAGGGGGDIKNKALHIEVAEVEASSPSTLTPTSPLPPYGDSAFPPSLADAGRQISIFSQKKIDSRPMSPERKSSLPNPQRKRSATTSKQVSMRAFQFFRLIPWYTEGNPNTDLQVAQHFESKRPAVGICLKRFSAIDDTGTKWTKRNDYIDIPIESGIPGFLHDDDLGEEVFPNWKFKLSLQSVICHRGDTLERGHYISVVRVQQPTETIPMPGVENILQSSSDAWVIHDDLAKPSRVQYVDIEKVLKEETPYLLFYKIVLIEGDNPGRVSFDGRPPSYSSSEDQSRALSLASPATTSPTGSARPSQSGNTSLSAAPPFTRAKSNASSVISNTPGPPIEVQSAASPDIVTNDFQQGPAREAEQQNAEPHPYPSDSANDEVAETETAGQIEEASARKSEERARSRHSGSSNSGSISRLSQIFKPRASSKEAPVVRGEETAARSQLSTAAVLGTANAVSSSSPSKLAAEEPQQATRRGFRKSMDEMRNSRRKEKEREKEKEKEKEKESGHRRDRSKGGRRKSRRFDDPDRECIVM